eukprot:gene2010-2332_t
MLKGPVAATAPAARDTADVLRHLLAADLICRDASNPDCFVFTVPGASTFVKSVVSGRKELLQLLSRRKYQEALDKELQCTKLRGSCLTVSFHIRDLQGRGLITTTSTTAGVLVRLVKRK